MLIFAVVWFLFVWIPGFVGLCSAITYFIMAIVQKMLRPQDLKKKYRAQWAVVTGASSGIGKAITLRLAEQQINVVLVALDDDFLHSTHRELTEMYPDVKFLRVGVNLGLHGSYMAKIAEATAGLDVALLFNNAGFVIPGLFADIAAERINSNLECNATACVNLTHHFLQGMLRRKRGLIAFTSSMSAYMPCPTVAIYSSSKAFLTNFATALAGEVRHSGVDIVAIHPSPVQTDLYQRCASTHMAMNAAQMLNDSPFVIADQIFAAAGRVVIRDHGLLCAAFRLVNKGADSAFLAEAIARLSHLAPDHQTLSARSSKHR